MCVLYLLYSAHINSASFFILDLCVSWLGLHGYVKDCIREGCSVVVVWLIFMCALSLLLSVIIIITTSVPSYHPYDHQHHHRQRERL